MPRSRISPDLGRLPRVPGLKKAERRPDDLRQLLRSLAIKNQREQPRIFYSLREVASKFKVPVSTVSKVYREMEQEGLLSRVRGSKTVLNGLRNSRRLSVRGLVALPAMISHFVTIQEYRTFFIWMRRELWLRGFATTTLFLRPDEEAHGTLVDQLKDFDVDTVIWLQPGRSCFETLLRLSDMGIRIIAISQVGTPSIPTRYFVWRERAIEKLVKEWKGRNQVRKITVVHSQEYRSIVTEEVLNVVLEHLRIESDLRTAQTEDIPTFLRELSNSNADGIIFPCSGLASLFAFRSPRELADLLAAKRVALADGPIDMPFSKIPDVPVDVVKVNWHTIVESIVNDLITREAFERNRYTTFEADAHFRIPLSSLCDEMRPSRGIAASV
jgi:hypothetical protein